MKKINILKFICAALICMCIFTAAKAQKCEAASAVTVGDINYEKLTLKVYKNGNGNIYFYSGSTVPTELTDWDEMSGTVKNDSDGKGDYILMDISWASSSSDVKFNVRGDKDTTAVVVTLPKQISTFKVTFDKISGDFSFTGNDERNYFFYRKSTDYNWIKVYFSGKAVGADGISYSEFLKNVEALRFKGTKLIFKLGQVVGTSASDYGERPSKDVSVSISKYSTAPTMKVNITKLTINTKSTMEYANSPSGPWTTCSANMTVDELASEVLYTNSVGTKAVLYFRTQATEKKPCSQTFVLEIEPQAAPPTVGTTSGCDVTYAYTDNGKMTLTFNNASKTVAYEYWIVKDGDTSKPKWKTVKSAKSITITAKAAEGADIYVRLKGVNANTSKNIKAALPSAHAEFTADGFIEKDK